MREASFVRSGAKEDTERRKKILFVLPNSGDFGGLERHLLQLLERLLPIGVQVSILCCGPDVISERIPVTSRGEIQVRSISEPGSFWQWIRQLARPGAGTVVFSYGWIYSFPWYVTLAAALAGISRRYAIHHLVLPEIPPAYTGRGFYGMLRRSLGSRARMLYGWRVAALFCQKTICVSDAVRNCLADVAGIPRKRLVTIRNGISVAEFTPTSPGDESVRRRLGVLPDDFLIVCVARLSKVKGIDILLRAVARARRCGADCKCAILGEGPLKDDLKEQAKSLGLEGVVFFEGFRDVKPYLQASSAFLLTSHAEGLPLSVLEAMACGLPCIVTNVGGNAEAVEHGISGIVVPPGAEEELAAAIVRLATHPDELSKMATKAREIVCGSFDLDRQMRRIVDLIVN